MLSSPHAASAPQVEQRESDDFSGLVLPEGGGADEAEHFTVPWPDPQHPPAEQQASIPEQLVGPSAVTDELSAALPPDPLVRAPPIAAAPIVAAPVRTAEMEAVARQAEQHVRRGYTLAARGAFFSARTEFIQALRLISQALDTQAGENRCGEALQAGLLALKEAEDFVPRGSRLEADIDVAHIVSGHQTPVLKSLGRRPPQPLVALQRYYNYAQEQLALAAGGEEAGSMALYSLGKIYGTMAERGAPRVVAPEPKAMVFHQAALAVDAGNYMAANELGVLLARWGRYEQARDLLQHSVALSPTAAAWTNLAAVHQHLGERELAELARREALAASQRERAAAQAGREGGNVPPADIRWVDPDTFAATSQPSTDLQRPVSAPSSVVPGAGPAPPAVAPPAVSANTAAAPNTAQRPWIRWWPFTTQKAGPVRQR